MAEEKSGQQALLTSFWQDHPVMTKVLGLCPALAVSNSLHAAFVLGVITLVVLMLATALMVAIRQYIHVLTRLPIFMALLAGMVLLAERIMQLVDYSTAVELGIFLPLVTTNCILLARLEAERKTEKIHTVLLSSLGTGFGFLLFLLPFAAVREFGANGYVQLFAYRFVILDHWNMAIWAMAPGGFFLLSLAFVLLRVWGRYGNKQSFVFALAYVRNYFFKKFTGNFR